MLLTARNFLDRVLTFFLITLRQAIKFAVKSVHNIVGNLFFFNEEFDRFRTTLTKFCARAHGCVQDRHF